MFTVFSKKRINRFFSFAIFSIVICSALWSSCSSKRHQQKDEQIRITSTEPEVSGDTLSANSIRGNLSLNDIASYPQKVVLTGLRRHRLVTVYKSITPAEKNGSGSYRNYYYDDNDETVEHFMPGVDLIFGYNLLNIGHYDLTTETLNFLFAHPVLVKSLYYPSFVQDSLDKKPVNRDYFLVSVYDADTNADTLINRNDLRRFYHFNASCTEKTQLIPPDYSVVRSQYDSSNDVMYIFARHDTNHNGEIEKQEPLHIFWLDLKGPSVAKRLY